MNHNANIIPWGWHWPQMPKGLEDLSSSWRCSSNSSHRFVPPSFCQQVGSASSNGLKKPPLVQNRLKVVFLRYLHRPWHLPGIFLFLSRQMEGWGRRQCVVSEKHTSFRSSSRLLLRTSRVFRRFSPEPPPPAVNSTLIFLPSS